MQKGQVKATHWVLFGVAILAVSSIAKPYVQEYMAERNQVGRNAGMPGGQGGPGRGNPQQMAARMLERMTQDLKLTPAQQAQVKEIQESSFPQMQKIRSNSALSPEQRREQMRPLRIETQNRIKQVLTPEQQTKYESMLAEMRARFGARGGGRGGNNNGGGAP